MLLEKPKVTFRIVPHALRPGQQIVQICLDGGIIGSIFADQDKPGIKVVSVHITETEIDPEFKGEVLCDDGSETVPPIPQVKITFNPEPWHLGPEGVVRPGRN